MRRFFLAALVLAASALPAAAQTSASSNLTSTATVVSPISISITQPLAFGKLTASQVKTIAADDAANAGQFYVQGDGGAAVTLSVTAPANLVSGANTLPLSALTGTQGATNGSGNSTFSPVPGGTVLSIPGAGTTQKLYVHIGGTVTAGAGQPTGAYTGNIALNVAYN
jgi:hypothetical protein